MSDEILDELKAIRETLENIAQVISLSVGVEPRPMNVEYHAEDVHTAWKKWRDTQRKPGGEFGLF